MISRCICFRLQPSRDEVARPASRAARDGRPFAEPAEVARRRDQPVPKCCCQSRLTITRAVSGLSGDAIQRASAVRRPVEPGPTPGAASVVMVIPGSSTLGKPGSTTLSGPGAASAVPAGPTSVTTRGAGRGAGFRSSNAASCSRSAFQRASFSGISLNWPSRPRPAPSLSRSIKVRAAARAASAPAPACGRWPWVLREQPDLAVLQELPDGLLRGPRSRCRGSPPSPPPRPLQLA